MQKLLGILLTLVALLPSCMQIPQKTITKRIHLGTASCAQENLPCPQAPTITIWIHGTRLLPKSFFTNFFYSKPGLHHYSLLECKYYQHKIAKTLIQSNASLFCDQHFYLFGWPGNLSHDAREAAAKDLYHALKIIREQYKQKYGVEPIIRIISHSHGGNIALLLEKVKDSDDTQFAIEQLILLACPIQSQTMHYARAPLFKNIYSLFSILDLLQIADPQGLRTINKKNGIPLFSQRRFSPHPKIKQAAIKLDDRSIAHLEFIRLDFLSRLSGILDHIDSWDCPYSNDKNLINADKCICINTKNSKTISHKL